MFKRSPRAGGPGPPQILGKSAAPPWMRRKSANLIEIPENLPLLPLAEKLLNTAYRQHCVHALKQIDRPYSS